ncbi:lactoylglutathione lyase [Natronospira proteinivora]|uniref:Lactoylglutathione lyase n=1 Tax=Natronospira proteinivora TaxID=1807133 RepID=A0ABT1GBJ2_9GAMM|nr:ArsI/CadI family heavy metal resistance metalloenzyme [Natronospira proteinivora]MCP1727643.1 lactoylglutathione lyase [Natronospira proteinivora]
MKRLHVHVGVADLEQSIRFYSHLFGQSPSKQRQDYAKWMLEDPRVNFAISARGAGTGIDHLGFQVDSEAELAQLKEQAVAADQSALVEEGEATCCYAQSEKHWTVDPQGIAWEHFHTMGEVNVFGNNSPQALSEKQAARAATVDSERQAACGCG